MFHDTLKHKRDPERTLELLSSSLQVEVAMHISLPLLKASYLFVRCSSGFTASLAVLLKEVTLAADSVLFQDNDICSDLYVVGSGHVNVVVRGPDARENVRLPLVRELWGALPGLWRHMHAKGSGGAAALRPTSDGACRTAQSRREAI